MKKTGWSGPWIHGPEPTWHFLHREPELLTMVNFSSCEMMVVVPVLHCPRLLSTPVSDTLPAHLGLPSPKTVHSFGSNVCRPPSEELMSSSLCALTKLSTLLPKHFFFFLFFYFFFLICRLTSWHFLPPEPNALRTNSALYLLSPEFCRGSTIQ